MTDKEQLYFDALQEIAERLGHSIEHPISVSLLCLQLGISNDEKGKIFVAFNQVLRKNASKELEVEKFKLLWRMSIQNLGNLLIKLCAA